MRYEKNNRCLLWLLLFVVLLSRVPASGGETNRDTVRVSRNTAVAPDSLKGEMILEAIDILGNVEKPGVIIMPKRLEPELESVELDRSFEDELREGTGDLEKVVRDLDRVDRVENIKKTVGRKRN